MSDVRPTPAFKSPLVTGAIGFIGMHLSCRLTAAGVRPVALVRPSSDRARVEALRKFADIASVGEDDDQLADLFVQSKPDVVFHLATRYIATHTPGDIPGLIADNVGLTARICEAASGTGCRALVYAGTAWQNTGSVPGDDTPAPNTLYAASKQAGDEIIDYYARARDLSAITLKIYDSYGPGDSRRKFLTVLDDTMARGETMKASPGDQKLHTVHVDDLVDGFVHAGNLLTTGEHSGRHCFTLPSPSAITLRELAQAWARAAGVELSVEWGATPYRPGEVMVPWEGTPLPGWSPRISLEDGLRTLQV